MNPARRSRFLPCESLENYVCCSNLLSRSPHPNQQFPNPFPSRLPTRRVLVLSLLLSFAVSSAVSQISVTSPTDVASAHPPVWGRAPVSRGDWRPSTPLR